MGKKLRTLGCVLIMGSTLFPANLIFAETVQDVPVGETTISSKAEDPLQEYKEKAQNQVPTPENTDVLDVPEAESESDASSEVGLEAAPIPSSDSGGEPPEIKNERIETRGGIMPMAGNVLEEGSPSSLTPYDIDEDFANAIRSIYPAAPNPMTDDFMESLTNLGVSSRNLTSLKGIEFAVNLTHLNCSNNQLSDLNVSGKAELRYLNCERNQLSSLDVSSTPALTSLYCKENQLSTLDVSSSPELIYLECEFNQLSTLDVSNNPALIELVCYSNQLSTLDLSGKPELTRLNCSDNQFSTLDVSNTPELTYLDCQVNQLNTLDLSNTPELTTFICNGNQLSTLDVSNNPELTNLRCDRNQLSTLDVSNNPKLRNLQCDRNQLSTLNVSTPALRDLQCQNNQLSTLDVSSTPALRYLSCHYNQLSTLDVSNNPELIDLSCISNQLTSITSLNGLTKLREFNARGQQILIPVPPVSIDGKAEIDVLRTTAQAGLSASNGTVSPSPTFNYNGDKILLSNVTSGSLREKYINFSYDASQLVEGAATGIKEFSGTITFIPLSELGNELKPVNRNKVYRDTEVEWNWTITSLTTKKAENIQAKLNLPAGLSIVPGSIVVQKNGSPGPAIGDLEVTNSLGDLDQGEDITITFKTTASGNVDDWLEATGDLGWEDDTTAGPYSNQSKGAVQILDDEQVYKPEESKDLALESFPKAFNYGVQEMKSTAATYNLHPYNYQTNTNVTTKGFHTRIKDDRAVSTGWKLTVGLSNFEDAQGQVMPNSAGTELVLGNLSIENILDRDTPQETINPTPTGTPSTVQTSETLVAGQTSKILISAQPGEGQEIWQLRMPFNAISLNVPANAGKKSTLYKAKLTWSLNDTP
ncbi:WxL domain-containing protein [Enterococcus sp. 669A]|uniref:WxL domain-containing protein n=1 Tax=Candidatus Enterococcus moelleringii TaxID=2815325 RepID=A0ABS3LAK9_9ENTE|nr:WxL domain-containing protein [Enterococcus sp. 669A]MBO1306120.1 WxL domain-containing protein [Enterococcus sp. 669A]